MCMSSPRGIVAGTAIADLITVHVELESLARDPAVGDFSPRSFQDAHGVLRRTDARGQG
ncbi:hypothetical protein ABIB34_002204 [Rhodococcus sp. UYP5]